MKLTAQSFHLTVQDLLEGPFRLPLVFIPLIFFIQMIMEHIISLRVTSPLHPRIIEVDESN
jgi:hypothetical protein